MRRLVLLICFLSCYAPFACAQLSPYLCDTNFYPPAINQSPVLLPYLTFTVTHQGTAGVLTLINKQDTNIQYYMIVMEFFDDQGKYLFSAPVYNVDDKQRLPFDVPFHSWLLANWPGGTMAPIPARSKSREIFATQLVTLICPASVRISVIWLKYENRTEFKYIAEDLSLFPTPRNPVKFKSIREAKAWSPATVIVRSYLKKRNLSK